MRPTPLVAAAAALVVLPTWGASATVSDFAPTAVLPAGPLRVHEPGITPELVDVLDAMAPGETTRVVVTMREQADVDVAGLPSRRRSRAVVSALRDTADATQQTIGHRLRVWSREGRVSDVEPLWVVNAVSVTATAPVVEQLAARSDVLGVGPDEVDIRLAATAEPGLDAVRAPEVWAQGDSGQGVVVATLDTGVDGTHPDLASRWRGGSNGWLDPYGQHTSGPIDLSGHGTATMGTIVGGDAGGTAIGVAPGAKWIAARIFDDAGNGTVTAIHQSFQWLLDPDGNPTTDDVPDVVNGSWAVGAGPACDLTFQPDVQALVAAGILPVFAAGNFGSGSSSGASPANYPESVAVGALATSGSVLSVSSRGPDTCGGRTAQFPDLVAPGQHIVSADRYGLYQSLTGTSMAAPHVAGVLALVLSAAPGLAPSEQRALLLSTAVDLGPTGPDNGYGAGRVDALAAYEAAVSFPPPPPPPPPVVPAALEYSTVAGASPPGVTGSPDDADVYAWNGTDHQRALDLSAAPYSLPARARVDGFSRRSATRFLVSFARNVRVPRLGPVQDEDVVAFDGTRWRRWFDGTAHGLRRRQLDLDAVSVAGGVLYFSTTGGASPPGVRGRGDDADLYRWNGNRFRRVWNASAHGLPRGADVDGLDVAAGARFWVSFAAARTRVPTLGRVPDEDVLHYTSGSWAVEVDGTAAGLTADGLDVDAIDLP